MRWSVVMLVGLVQVALASGCHSCDRVESELRVRENEVRELREELERREGYNQTLQQELRTLRGDACPPGIEAAKVGPSYPVRTLVLGRQTAGRPSDHCAGDDALQVLVEPRDPEGQAIKAPGTLAVQAVEISTEGIKRPLSSWEIPPEQLQRSWRNGLFTTGYSLTLPWKVWPSTEKVRVVAQLRMADGRVFEADKDITVRLAPIDQRRPVAEEPAEPPAHQPDILPPPRPFLPGQGPPVDPTSPHPAPAGTPAPTPTPSNPVSPASSTPGVEILRPVVLVPRG